jgi:hypothetical protein
MLLEEGQAQPSTAYPEVVQETVPQEVHKEVQPSAPSMLSVGEGLFLINSLDPEGLLQRNMYLRIYEKGDSHVPLLFNVLPYHRLSTARDEIEKAIGKLEKLRALVLMDLLPEDTQSILNLLNLAPKLYVITSLPIALSLIGLGVPERRIKLVESFPDGLLNLGAGDVLRFIKTPFLPEKGSFVVFEEKTKTLFSSKLFSSYCLPEEYSANKTADVERVVLYHRLNFSGIENAISLAQIRLLNPSVIRPAFGNPILEGVDEVIERISKQKNTFNLANLEDETLIRGLLSSILFEMEKRIPKEKYELILDGLGEYVDVKAGTISNSFVDVKKLPELFVYTLHSAKGTTGGAFAYLRKALRGGNSRIYHMRGFPILSNLGCNIASISCFTPVKMLTSVVCKGGTSPEKYITKAFPTMFSLGKKPQYLLSSLLSLLSPITK